ncbi:hypothetical protein L207DRAFT_565077 [Hyaloscypha variabilis F]|uniref:Uncharacterized protein n=1 Tax=Hyaloscypha variabilis (strain UAMH 11265 / GT02V1 / F) TaxID=1149755 RepID=A0A2J6RRH0_HYAVF|nr:hypothetical protein L207DRAFT_565077 [Hyaloscypha variabilis F]
MAEPRSNKGDPKAPSIQVTPATSKAETTHLSVSEARRGGTTTTPSPSEANSRQPILTANDREPYYHPAPPNISDYNGSEAPSRVASLLPPAEPEAIERGNRLNLAEGQRQIQALCARIWKDNMGKLYDKVVEADRRGHVDDKLYADLLDFFYCFLPMVMKAPLSDPIIVSAVALENHRKILNLFGEERGLRGRAGRNDTHMWYSRPSDGSFKSRLSEGFRGLQTALVGGKKGKGDKTVVK